MCVGKLVSGCKTELHFCPCVACTSIKVLASGKVNSCMSGHLQLSFEHAYPTLKPTTYTVEAVTKDECNSYIIPPS